MMLQTFKVLVGNEFPLDMLAHDYCFPANIKEAGKIKMAGPRQIMMARIVQSPSESPDVKMWKDSGCRIESIGDTALTSTNLSISVNQMTKELRKVN